MADIEDDELRIFGQGWPISFRPGACTSCEAHCCRGEPGAVWITDEDVDNIAQLLEQDQSTIRTDFVRRLPEGLALKENTLTPGDHPCVFLDLETHACRIYGARPTQCRTFPFWDYFKAHPGEAAQECPGVERVAP